MMDKKDSIRNFSIVAHIDHGKSTLADRMIEFCSALTQREMRAQVLDSMDIEQERGITIKAQTVRLCYKAKNGKEYSLNLIDTPGHVDFSYEVSRSLAACEGSLLVVDAAQGVEAQTLANVYQAIENDHSIIPVLNKIDLPAADPESVKKEIEEVIGIETKNTVLVSAKTGAGIEDVLEAIINQLPPPISDDNNKLKALLVDSWYDKYLGVVVLVRVKSGILRKGDKVRMISTGITHTVDTAGVFTPKKVEVEKLSSGEVGYIVAGIKEVAECKVGDTITLDSNPCEGMLPAFKESKPVVFCGLYPSDVTEFSLLKMSLGKLKLNDSSFVFEQESSSALGFGFRCGFLGLLHLEIIRERLLREFNISVITTSPSVVYKVHMTSGEVVMLHNPSQLPDPVKIKYIEEPLVRATMITPSRYIGDVMELSIGKRGTQIDIQHSGNRVICEYKIPLNEIVYDFYDKLKSYTQGYASFDWQFDGYEQSELVKLNILINKEVVDSLSQILHRSRVESRGREMCIKLKDLIPRHLFAIPIQAAIGGKIIARETISALRKDVTAKCYGGDITRKRKLLEKQKAGKKKMRSVGKVDIPQSAFVEVIKSY